MAIDLAARHKALLRKITEAGFGESIAEVLQLDAIWIRGFVVSNETQAVVHFFLRSDERSEGSLALLRRG